MAVLGAQEGGFGVAIRRSPPIYFCNSEVPPVYDFLSDLERLTSDSGKSRFLAALEMTGKGRSK